MIYLKKILFTSVFIIIGAIGVALSLKAAVGVGAWDAFSQSTSMVTGIKVGTFSMMMNISCVLLQILILRKDFNPLGFLQIGMAVLLGLVVNIMFYDVLSLFTIDHYLLNLLLFMGALMIVIFAVSLIMSIEFLSFPLEAACLVVAEKMNMKFGFVRQMVDFACIIGAIALAWIFNNPTTVREGTIIGMLLFGPLIAIFMDRFKPFVRRLGLLDRSM